MSKKLVLEFFRLYSVDDYRPEALYSFYVDWAKRRRRKRVSYSHFSFLLSKYLKEQNTKKLKIGDFR